ncbi:glyoxalase/bleomycin resistance protein/dioxygenase superfamily protein [Mucilaginibacter yixingensis]|uniref:Glyoxalase/bleomycin resistance protein/dioxygenase superfamily protein n=1 Tax=Mucilaginibacter yixingensis TaxID=1295612 RepID=A0A2T5JA38_9SPHI|nr:VOC family protein [Mucilaginibacter yixingensis]PTQ96879.1 glyoxalase/bleomycin resistance protein/dioxygenase superfamily protein [Mucilaginibacter yixingensis]
MKLRTARHTDHLQPIIDFYTQLLGLQLLGEFKDHAGYDGVFIGIPHAAWHLEFTTSAEAPIHQPDDDDLLVFYPDTEKERNQILDRFRRADIAEVVAKNPYWNNNGRTFTDPDGFRIVIAM